MVKKIYVFFFFLSLTTFFSSAQNPEAIKFDSTEFNFGTFHEEKGPVTHIFHFTNISSDTLKVIEVRSSCGCTIPDWTRKPILPNEKGFVKAIYNPRNRVGAFTKNLIVVINTNPDGITLHISGNVLPRPKTIAENYMIKIGNLRLKSNLLDFHEIKNTAIKTDTMKIYNDCKLPMIISFKEVPSFLKCKAVPSKLDSSSEGLIIIKYNASIRKEFGVLYDNFIIHTNDTITPDKKFGVSAEIMEDFSGLSKRQLADAPKMVIDTNVYNFGKIKKGQKINFSFTISNTGKNDLLIRRIKSNCVCILTNLEKLKLKKGESTKLSVEFHTEGRTGEQLKSVELITNDPKKPNVTLIIKGEIK